MNTLAIPIEGRIVIRLLREVGRAVTVTFCVTVTALPLVSQKKIKNRLENNKVLC